MNFRHDTILPCRSIWLRKWPPEPQWLVPPRIRWWSTSLLGLHHRSGCKSSSPSYWQRASQSLSVQRRKDTKAAQKPNMYRWLLYRTADQKKTLETLQGAQVYSGHTEWRPILWLHCLFHRPCIPTRRRSFGRTQQHKGSRSGCSPMALKRVLGRKSCNPRPQTSRSQSCFGPPNLAGLQQANLKIWQITCRFC